jgi:hypothetical protein
MTAVHAVDGVTHWIFDGNPAVHLAKCRQVNPLESCCEKGGEEIMWHRVVCPPSGRRPLGAG